jgi:predicted site-specific integrase-resolvase
MKAILIARVSTEEQRDAGNSLPAQVARLEKYCQNKQILQNMAGFNSKFV